MGTRLGIGLLGDTAWAQHTTTTKRQVQPNRYTGGGASSGLQRILESAPPMIFPASFTCSFRKTKHNDDDESDTHDILYSLCGRSPCHIVTFSFHARDRGTPIVSLLERLAVDIPFANRVCKSDIGSCANEPAILKNGPSALFAMLPRSSIPIMMSSAIEVCTMSSNG
jgi:hypothetical protein